MTIIVVVHSIKVIQRLEILTIEGEKELKHSLSPSNLKIFDAEKYLVIE